MLEITLDCLLEFRNSAGEIQGAGPPLKLNPFGTRLPQLQAGKTRLELCNDYIGGDDYKIWLYGKGQLRIRVRSAECGARRDAKPRIGTKIR